MKQFNLKLIPLRQRLEEMTPDEAQYEEAQELLTNVKLGEVLRRYVNVMPYWEWCTHCDGEFPSERGALERLITEIDAS